MPSLCGLFIVLISSVAGAAEGHHEGIPHAVIFWQIFNLTIVFGLIYYFTRKSVPEYFSQRKAGYMASAQKSAEAKMEAEKQYLDIKHKLEHLENSYEESMARAHAEAADLRKQLMNEATEAVRRIQDEARVTTQIEMQKARRDVHEQFVRQTVGMARSVLAKDISSGDQQKLQNDFAKNIEGVSP